MGKEGGTFKGHYATGEFQLFDVQHDELSVYVTE